MRPRFTVLQPVLVLFALLPLHAQNLSYTINTFAGQQAFSEGGAATKNRLRRPEGLAADSAGNVYVADPQDNRVREILTNGTIKTIAGTGLPGYTGDGGMAINATLFFPESLALDSNGNLFIADAFNNVVRKVNASGIISTYAGNGSVKFDPTATLALSTGMTPTALTLDPQGNLYISDTANYRIEMVQPNGIISTICGNGMAAAILFGFDQNFNLVISISGDGGAAGSAEVSYVDGLGYFGGTLYLADTGVDVIRSISNGVINTIAGIGPNYPQQIYISPGNLAISTGGAGYFSDLANNQVDQLGGNAIVGNGKRGFSGDGGPPLQAEFNLPYGVALDGKNNLYISDALNVRVREVTGGSSPTVKTIAGVGPEDGGPATSAVFDFPAGVATDGTNLYIADSLNSEIRKTPLTPGVIQALSTVGSQYGDPVGLALDAKGNVYATTDFNQVIEVSPSGQATLLAGTGVAGFQGDGGQGSSAELSSPIGIAVDAAGNVYVADNGNHRVRKITPGGVIQTVAGSPGMNYSGDGGQATQAAMDPTDVKVDSSGNLYIADHANSRVRKVDTTGTIATIAGNGTAAETGDGGPATNAAIGTPLSLAFDSSGALYIGDDTNYSIWRLVSGKVYRIAGNGAYAPESGDGGPALNASLDPIALALDPSGNIYVADQFNDRIRILKPAALAVGSLTLVSGDAQSGAPGSALSNPLVVKAVTASGAPFAGATVSFQVTSGSASLSQTSVVTGSDGTASVLVTLGASAGAVVVTASIAGGPSVQFHLTAGMAPAIASGGIIGAGSSLPPVAAVSPGGIFSIYGSLLSAATHSVGQADLVNGALPTNVDGVCVEVGGMRAPLFFISPGQINAQAPTLTAGPTQVVVIAGCDTSTQISSTAISVQVQAVTPEFIAIAQNSSGGEAAAVDYGTGVLVGPANLISGVNFAAAQPGDIVVVYALGFGALSTPVASGALATAADPIAGTAIVQLGGVTLTPDQVPYIGATPGDAGLYQVNLTVPSGIPPGPQPLVITINGVSSPATTYLEIGQ